MLISTVVKYSPYSVGKNPVNATPKPSKAREITAKVCSLMTSSTKMTVKDKKPGTSRRLCRIPISTPVNAARSTAKLFNRADQVLNANGMAMDIKINRVMGVRQLGACIRVCIEAYLKATTKTQDNPLNDLPRKKNTPQELA